MQMKDTEKFDLEIRSLLQDAEVKPSRRVWKAVSSRLQEQEAASRAWMRWAGLCAAAFAAIALGVFFSMDHPEKNVPVIGQAEVSQILSQAVPQQDAAVPESQAEPAEAQARPSSTRPARESAIAIAPVQEPVPAVSEPEPVAQPAPAAEPAPARESAPAVQEPAPVKESAPAREYVPINWEQEKKASRPVQLYAQGSLLGNESDISLRKGRAYGSSGVTASKTGVTELGESSYGIPFSLGLGVRFYVLPKFAIGTGLDYSFLTRGFKGQYINTGLGINVNGDVTHNMHYIGIPLNVSYDFVSTQRLKVYALAGGEAEYCVSNKYSVIGPGATYDYSSPVRGLQWSVGAGVGVEFRFTKWLGIYLDPGIRYYFDCNQPKSVRTEKPVMVNFDAGLRFGF